MSDVLSGPRRAWQTIPAPFNDNESAAALFGSARHILPAFFPLSDSPGHWTAAAGLWQRNNGIFLQGLYFHREKPPALAGSWVNIWLKRGRISCSRHLLSLYRALSLSLIHISPVGGERLTVQLVEVYKAGEHYTFGFDKLGRWIDLCRRAGITHLSLIHI